MRRIILTGATGVLGVAMVEECLRRGVEVCAVVRPASPRMGNLTRSFQGRVEVIEWDLARLDEISGEGLPPFDTFFHLGWTDTSREGRDSPALQARNIDYSLAAVRLAARLGCGSFVGAGSQAEYGLHRDPATGPESPADPLTPYGISKLAAGKLCRLEAAALGMAYAWVRVFSVYGKCESADTMIPTMIPKLLRNEPCPLTDGAQTWDFLFSEDAGRALYMLGEAMEQWGPEGRVYCLGSGEGRSIRSYLEEMRETLGSSSELGFGQVPYRHGVPLSICADITSLCRDTGWTPQVPFQEGILREARRMREEV